MISDIYNIEDFGILNRDQVVNIAINKRTQRALVPSCVLANADE